MYAIATFAIAIMGVVYAFGLREAKLSELDRDASLNPDIGNADDIFRGLLKKVAKTGYGIVIDEVTRNIDLASFCASPPPPIPDDINENAWTSNGIFFDNPDDDEAIGTAQLEINSVLNIATK